VELEPIGGFLERGPVVRAKPAAEALALLSSQCDDQPGGRRGGLACRQDDLRDPPAPGPAEVHAGVARQFDELGPADLLERLVDGQLARPEPRQHPPHRAVTGRRWQLPRRSRVLISAIIFGGLD